MYQCLEIQCLKIRKEEEYSLGKDGKQRIAVHLGIFEECIAAVSDDVYCQRHKGRNTARKKNREKEHQSKEREMLEENSQHAHENNGFEWNTKEHHQNNKENALYSDSERENRGKSEKFPDNNIATANGSREGEVNRFLFKFA